MVCRGAIILQSEAEGNCTPTLSIALLAEKSGVSCTISKLLSREAPLPYRRFAECRHCLCICSPEGENERIVQEDLKGESSQPGGQAAP